MEREDLADFFYTFVLVAQSVLGFLQLLDAVNFLYYPTLNRLSIPKNFSLGFSLVVPLTFLLFGWIGYMTWRKEWRAIFMAMTPLFSSFFLGSEISISIVSILACAIGIWVFQTKFVRKFIYILISVYSGFNLLSLISLAFVKTLGLGSYLEGISNLWIDLFYVNTYIAPLGALLFLFLWLYQIFLIQNFRIKADKQTIKKKKLTLTSKVIFTLSLLLALYSVVYSYLPQINSKGVNIGVDMNNYIEALEKVEADPNHIYVFAKGSRPLIFLVLMGFKQLTGLSTIYTVRYIPILLNFALVSAVYFLGYELTMNSEIAAFSAFFTSTGFQITVGMYSYYLANTLGLILVTCSLGLLFRALRKNCKYSLLGASILSVLLVFTHPWTLDHYLAGLAITSGLILFRDRKNGKKNNELKMMAVYFVVTMVAELMKMAMGGLGGVMASSTLFSNTNNIAQFWDSAIIVFRLRYGGYFSNILIIGLALIGNYYLSFKGIADDYFHWFLILTSLVFLFSNEAIKSRLLFNIPFGLYASMGLEKVSTWMDQRLIKVFAITYSMAYLFMCLSNLI